MKAGRLGRPHPAARETEAIIVFWVGPYRMAIYAGALKEIRNEVDLEGQEPAILSAPSLFGVPPGRSSRLLVLRRGNTIVRVNRVERMIETGPLRPLPQAFQGAERRWYCGLAIAGETVIPVVKPETLELEAKAAQAAMLPATGYMVNNIQEERPAL
jgi:hypothetical protein